MEADVQGGDPGGASGTDGCRYPGPWHRLKLVSHRQDKLGLLSKT